MVIQIFMILNASLGMDNYTYPIPADYPKEGSLQWESSYIWLEIE